MLLLLFLLFKKLIFFLEIHHLQINFNEKKILLIMTSLWKN